MNRVVDFTDDIADRAKVDTFLSGRLLTDVYNLPASKRRDEAVEELVRAVARWAAREGYNLASGVSS